MSDSGMTIECDVHFGRAGRGARKELREGPPPAPGPGRVPLVSRLMALALKCDRLIREGALENHAQVAVLGHVTRARVSQIMGLLNLAPDIIDAVLHLPPTASGRDAVILADLRPIAAVTDWEEQQAMWQGLRRGYSGHGTSRSVASG